MTDRETFAPLVFFEYDHAPGMYCLMLSDNHMYVVDDVFDECGQDANGYGWEGVSRSAVRERAPGLAERIQYDSEAGTFVAHSQDADALHQLGVLLRQAFHDHSVLKELIAAGEPEWFG
jgi:Immunity protein 51